MENVSLPGGKLIQVYSYVKVHEKQIANTIRGMIQNCMKHIMQTVTNKIVSRTLPNTPQNAGNVTKRNVNALKHRIRNNFTNKGDFLQTYPNNSGKPIFDEKVASGSTMLPVVVVKPYRGRPKKGHKVNQPDKVYEPRALLTYIKRHTEMKSKRSTVMRYRKKGSHSVWTTKQYLYAASRLEEARAGNNIYGWSSLASQVGSAAMNKSVNMGKATFDSPGGSARITPATFSSVDRLQLSALNNNAPAETKNYQQRVIDVNVPKWVNDAFKREMKFMSPKRLL